MKIVNIETFLVDAGFRPLAFVKIETDEGITGWGECSCPLTQHSVLGAIDDMKPILIGTDPRAYEMRFWDMYRRARLGSTGGTTGKAMGGIECALLDIKAKALGISVTEMFGGPMRETIPLYWSHFCVNRMVAGDAIPGRQIKRMSDVADAAEEVVSHHFKALKTNIFFPGGRVVYDGFEGGPGTTDQVATTEMLRHSERLFRTIRDAVGPDFGIILDLNFNFKPESVIKIAKALAPYDLMWIELDMYDPESLMIIKEAIDIPLCSGEVFFYMEQYRPYFEKRCADIVMIDAIWNGMAQAKKVGDLAQIYQMNVCPHNYYSHLATFVSASLCAVLPNVRTMEIDMDDIPWKDDMVTHVPEIIAGEMTVPLGRPGWGTDINEREIRKRLWGAAHARPVSVPDDLEQTIDMPVDQLDSATPYYMASGSFKDDAAPENPGQPWQGDGSPAQSRRSDRAYDRGESVPNAYANVDSEPVYTSAPPLDTIDEGSYSRGGGSWPADDRAEDDWFEEQRTDVVKERISNLDLDAHAAARNARRYADVDAEATIDVDTPPEEATEVTRVPEWLIATTKSDPPK